MKYLLICLLLVFGAPLHSQAVQTPNPDIQDVITRQMDLFQRDDFEQAFDLASPGIRNVFQTPERFGQMVTQAYPMVHRPRSYQFSDLREVAGQLWQKLIIQDQSGQYYALEYQMIQTDGGWKINAVQITPMPQVGV